MKNLSKLACLMIVIFILFGCGDNHEGKSKTLSVSSWENYPYEEVIEKFEKAGFTNIQSEGKGDLILGWMHDEGDVEEVSIEGYEEYPASEWIDSNTLITIKYYSFDVIDNDGNVVSSDDQNTTEDTENDDINKDTNDSNATNNESAAYYTTNTEETYKNGDSGIYAYKSEGMQYDIYYIINFDEGFVYTYTKGNESESCDKIKIDSGTLNDAVIITYHDGNTEWSNKLYFAWRNQPDRFIAVQDDGGYESYYYPTDLEAALENIDNLKIIEW